MLRCPAEALRKVPAHRPVRIFFQDESRWGRLGDLRRCWAPSDFRPVVAQQRVGEFLYATAVVSPSDGQLRSLLLPYMDASTLSLFLRYLRGEFPREFCLIFLDGAGGHRARDLQVPPGMKRVFLPPYSPELNPVEHLREHLRENAFGNRVFGSLDEVEEALCEGLGHLQEQEETVRSLCLFDWINTISLMSS